MLITRHMCLFSGTDPDSSDSSYETAHTSCSSMKWLTMGYALCTVLVLLFIDKVSYVHTRLIDLLLLFCAKFTVSPAQYTPPSVI